MAVVIGAMVHTTAQTIKITTCEQKRWKDAKGSEQWGIGNPNTAFVGKPGQGATVYFKYDVTNSQNWGVGRLVELVVYQVRGEERIVSWRFPMKVNGSAKAGSGFTYTGFTPGDYEVVFKDTEGEEKVYTKNTFTVKSETLVAKPAPGGLGVFTVCLDTDDNWNAIGAATTFKIGTCVNFMVKLPYKIPRLESVGWEIFRVAEDGTETFFNELSMQVHNNNVNRFATTQCSADFGQAGKYRIYAVDWADRTPTSHHMGEFYKYLAKTEIVVQ